MCILYVCHHTHTHVRSYHSIILANCWSHNPRSTWNSSMSYGVHKEFPQVFRTHARTHARTGSALPSPHRLCRGAGGGGGKNYALWHLTDRKYHIIYFLTTHNVFRLTQVGEMLPVLTVSAFLPNVGHTCGQVSINYLSHLRVLWSGTLSSTCSLTVPYLGLFYK